jgi:RimJ/RimL family protein N-acetyltransferase
VAIDPLLLHLPTCLEGENIELRAYTDTDSRAVWEAVDANREHLAQWMPWVNTWKERAESKRYVRRMQAAWIMRQDLVFGIFDKAGDLIGACGLHDPDWITPKFSIGYWIGAASQGKGHVTEALRLMTKFGFEHLHANRLWISCDADNARSAAVPPRAGYTQEAYLRNERINVRGALSDTLIFGMTRSDYMENAPAGPPHG